MVQRIISVLGHPTDQQLRVLGKWYVPLPPPFVPPHLPLPLCLSLLHLPPRPFGR